MTPDEIIDTLVEVWGALKAFGLGYHTAKSAEFDELGHAVGKIEDILAVHAPERLEGGAERRIVAGERSLEQLANTRLDGGGDKILAKWRKDCNLVMIRAGEKRTNGITECAALLGCYRNTISHAKGLTTQTRTKKHES